MHFATALSEHPAASDATGQVIGEIIEHIGVGPDLAFLAVSRHHGDSMADIAAAIRTVVRPGTLIGATVSGVIAGGREVESQPGIALWAGRVGPCRPVRLVTERFTGSEPEFITVGLARDAPPSSAMVLLGDPFSVDVEALLGDAARTLPGLPVVGGLASAGSGPGRNRLVLDDQVFDDGAVAVLLPAECGVEVVVSQGCRPVGDPYIVTRSEGQLVHELGGTPALERLTSIVSTLPEDDRELLARGVHIGRVIDEHKLEFERGDFLVRSVLGADRDTGAMAVGDEPPTGATMQFQVRDAESAAEDLRALMATRSARGALLFTCNGRGEAMFGAPHHDASVVAGRVDGAALAGMSCAGEIGPVGEANFVHAYTATALLFT